MKLPPDSSTTPRAGTAAASPSFMQRAGATLVIATRAARNFIHDARYGGWLGSNVGTKFWLRRPGERGPDRGEYSYSRHHPVACLNNSGVEFLPFIFDGRIQPGDVLVDVGCGRGRVISWWLEKGFRNPIYGLELDAATAERTRQRYRRYSNVTILTGDAVANVPASGTLFYLFNPFGEATVAAFRDRVKQAAAPEQVRILYYNPRHVCVFEEDSAWSVQTVPVGDSSAAPFNPLAVITLKQ